MTFALVADAVSVGRKHAQPTEKAFRNARNARIARNADKYSVLLLVA